MPEGEPGARAEKLADEMLAALNEDAYQSLEQISWTFPRGHSFVWDKAIDSVSVKWDNSVVRFCTSTLQGYASQNGKKIEGSLKEELLQKAWAHFANDSFWLVAPYKIRDPGTTREYVKLIGAEGLLVHYSSGGVTPGDSYLWIIGQDKRPIAWRMWTQIIPIGGLEFSWHGWEEKGGAWFAPLHEGPISIDLTELKVK